MRSSLQNTSPCMHDNVTMVDKCKQGTPTSNMYVNNDFQMGIFYKFERMNSIISSSLGTFTMLSDVCISNLQCKISQLNQGTPPVIMALYLVHLPMGCAQLLNYDITAIGLTEMWIPHTMHSWSCPMTWGKYNCQLDKWILGSFSLKYIS